jgi:FMN reductase [NAD(P)H]
MGISDIITKRKCVRAYLDRPVTTEDLEGIISAGRWAPNHGDYRLSVIQDPALRKRFNDTAHKGMLESGIEFLQQRAALPGYQPLYDAPVLILLSGPADDPYSGINCALAAENMLLEATARGLASCFIVTPYFALAVDPSLAEAACIPEDYAFQCAVLAGHGAAEDPFSNPDRQPRGIVSYC